METSTQAEEVVLVESSTNNQSNETQPATSQFSSSSKGLVSLTDKDSPVPTNVSSDDEQSRVQNLSDVESIGSTSQPNRVIIENGGESNIHFVSSKEEVVPSEPEKQKQDGGYVGGGTIPPIPESQDGMKKKVLENLEVEEHIVNTSPTGRFVRYEQEIGRGSFKTVYKGLDTETGVAVAWCELLEHKFNKEEQSRFKEEVAILKTLNHPYILRLFDSWEFVRPTDKKRVLVLITELMTSGTLKSYMRRFKSIKPKVIRSWGRQILRGLSFLHTRTPPIIHRDLKCDNVFINGTTGLVKIGDLGLATLKRSDVKTVIGTPEFMAPEMYDEVYDESVDVYAFGMCLLEMCTLEYPYQECSNPAQIYKKVTSGIMPHSLNKVNDPMLKEIIVACTKLSKSARYTVEKLLNHEFFAEGDVKVEVMTEPTPAAGSMMVRLVVPRTSKENQKNEQESIEFAYNLQTDIPEDVVNDMVKSGILREEDKKNAIRSVRELTDPLTDPAKQKRQQKSTILPHGSAAGPGNGSVKEGGEGISHQIMSNEGTPLPQEIELSSNSRSNFQRQLSSASDETEPSGIRHTSDRTTASTQVNSVGVGVVGGGLGSEGPSANSSPNIPHKVTGGTTMTTPSENSEDSEKESIEDELSIPKKHNDVTSAPVSSKCAPPSSKTTPTLSKGRAGDEEKGEELQSLSTRGQGETVNRTYSEDGQQADLLSVSTSHNTQINVNNINDTTPSGRDLARSASFYSGSQTQSETQTSITHSQTSFSGTSVSQSGATQSSSCSTQSQTTSSSSISSGYHSQSSSTVPLSSSSSSSSPSVEADANGSGSTGTSGGGSFRSKKGSRTKDNKRIKLKFNEKVKDNVISCTLQTSAGQVINFKFSLEYDKPHEIFNNLVKAGHLSQLEESDFISQFQKVVDIVRSKSTGDSTSSDSKKNQGHLRSISTSYSSIVKQDSDQSKHSESYQKGVVGGARSDSPYDGSGQLGGAKRDGMALSETNSPHSRRKFEVSDVFVEKPNEKATITSQGSAESMTATSPVHSEDICILPPPSSDIKPSQDPPVHVFHSTTALPSCTLSTGDKGPTGDTPSSVATGNSYLSTTSSAISSASSSYSNLQPSGTVTPNTITVEAPHKKFEIEDVIDPETLSTESSTENLIPDDKAEPKNEVTPTESSTIIKDDESTSIELSTPPTYSDEDTLTYSRVKEMESSSKPHPPTTTNQPMYSPYSVQQVEPPPPLLLSPFSRVPPTHGTLLENPLAYDGFMKFMYYMKLLFEDPSITALLQQITTTTNNNNNNTGGTQPPSNLQTGSTAAATNGQTATGTNGHTSSNGQTAGTNGHTATGTNGNTAATNGHSTDGHANPVHAPVSHHSTGLLSSSVGQLANVSGVTAQSSASYTSPSDPLQQSDEETGGERQHLLREISRIEEEEKKLKKDKERYQAHLRRGSAISHESTNLLPKNSTATYPPHHVTSTSSAILSSAPLDEREQQNLQQQQLHYQQQQLQQNYYSVGSTTGQIPGYHPFHYYQGGPPLHPPSHDTRDTNSLLSQQKNASSSNLAAAAAGEASRHIETGRGTPYYSATPIGSHLMSQEGRHMIPPAGMWLPPSDWPQYMHPPHVPAHYSSTNQPILQGLHHSITPHIAHPPPPPPSSHLPIQQTYKQQQLAQQVQEHQTYSLPQQAQQEQLDPVGVPAGMTSPTRLEDLDSR